MTSWITSMFAGLFAGLGWTILLFAVGAAVAIWVFNKVVPAWLAPLVIALLGIAFVGNNVLKESQLQAERAAHLATKTNHAVVLQGIAEKTAEAHRLALIADQAVTRSEHEFNATIEGLNRDARLAQVDFDRRLAVAARATERVQHELTRIRGLYASACATANAAATLAGHSPAKAECAVGVLADLLGEQQRRAGIYAAEATEARARGLICERAYDAARAKLGQAQRQLPNWSNP